jgi:hypothetical protein
MSEIIFLCAREHHQCCKGGREGAARRGLLERARKMERPVLKVNGSPPEIVCAYISAAAGLEIYETAFLWREKEEMALLPPPLLCVCYISQRAQNGVRGKQVKNSSKMC